MLLNDRIVKYILNMIKLYMRCFAMKYDKNEEKEKLEQVNEELVKFMGDYPKDKLSFTAIVIQ